MRYQVVLTNVTGKIETIPADAGRELWGSVKWNPFAASAVLQSLPEFAAPVTLESFTRH